jgi:hypothetical protein
MPSLPNSPDPEEREAAPQETEVQELGSQDSFRRIYFGQLSEPLISEPPTPDPTPDDELTRAALEDPAGRDIDWVDPMPTSWRWIFLMVLGIVALATVFWKR